MTHPSRAWTTQVSHGLGIPPAWHPSSQWRAPDVAMIGKCVWEGASYLVTV